METFEEHYASMRRCILAHNPLTDMALIDRAVDYAAQKHRNQKRKDGSPYIIHPLAVAEMDDERTAAFPLDGTAQGKAVAVGIGNDQNTHEYYLLKAHRKMYGKEWVCHE